MTTESTIVIPSEPMVGDELLSFVKKNGGHLSKTDLAQATGYVSEMKDGKQRCNFTAMTDALVEATGIVIGKGAQSRGPGGRKLSYKAVVQGNCNLLIGKAYTAQLDLQPGDEFKIKLNSKSNTIRLIPIGAEADEEGSEDA